MDKEQHIPKYAAGGEMDRLDRPNRNSYQKRPPGRLFLLLILCLLFVCAAKHTNFRVPYTTQQTTPSSIVPSESFAFHDVKSEYDPETGSITISGFIRALRYLCYNIKITLEYSANGIIFYTDTQVIPVLLWNQETDFTFQFDLKEQCALHNIPGSAQFNCRIHAFGYFHI